MHGISAVTIEVVFERRLIIDHYLYEDRWRRNLTNRTKVTISTHRNVLL